MNTTEQHHNGQPPRPPFKVPFYYGWVILTLAMGAGLLASSNNQLFMGVMLKPISEDLGWTRTLTAGAVSAGTILAGIGGAFVGPIADRHGPRLLMPIGCLIASVALLALAGMNGLFQFYAANIVARVVAQSTLTGVTPITAITNWFNRRRGRAIGLTNMCLPLGAAILAFLAQFLIRVFGSWRPVFVVTGVCAALYAIPLALFMRRRPEDMGLEMEGGRGQDGARAGGHGAAARGSDVSFTLAQALRTRALWLVMIAQLIATVANSTYSFHQASYYSDLGLGVAVASLSVSMFGLAGAFSSTLWGFLSERVDERILASAVVCCGAGVMALGLFVQSVPMALLVSTLMGLTGRGEGSLYNILIARYYGRRSYGAITGFMSPFHMTGLGLGPIVGALSYDLTGSYRGTFVIYTGVLLTASLLTFIARPPRHPSLLQQPASGAGSPGTR